MKKIKIVKALFVLALLIINYSLLTGSAAAQINGADHGTVHPHGIFKHLFKGAGNTVIILKTAGSTGYIGFESVTHVRDTASALPIIVSTASNPYLNIYPDRATDSFYVKADTTIEYWIIKGNGVPVQGFGQGSASAAAPDSNIFATQYWVKNNEEPNAWKTIVDVFDGDTLKTPNIVYLCYSNASLYLPVLADCQQGDKFTILNISDVTTVTVYALNGSFPGSLSGVNLGTLKSVCLVVGASDTWYVGAYTNMYP